MNFKEFKSNILLETIDFFLQLCYNKNDFKKKTCIKLYNDRTMNVTFLYIYGVPFTKENKIYYRQVLSNVCTQQELKKQNRKLKMLQLPQKKIKAE